ncbi:MAG: hypothetical protein IJ639_00720 [Ruminococcus sp.]|nr:hypothetical protein [Ruminococcus sp.]
MNNRDYNNIYAQRRTRGAHFAEVNFDYIPEKDYFVNDNFDVNPAHAKKQGVLGKVIATVAITLVAAISVGAAVFFATKDDNRLIGSAPTATVQDAGALSDSQPTIGTVQTSAYGGETQAPASGDTAAMAAAKRAYAGHELELTDEANVIRVDGERVYMDTKRLAPENTGNPAHFYANGATSYGFDWNYSADNSNFVLACNYNFDQQQYDFTFYDTQEGTAHVTVYYNTGDNVQVPVQLTIYVDANLNVNQG